jgi:hypothetical protein
MRQITKIFLAISLVFSLSACGYGSVPHTATMAPAGNGTDVIVGELKIQEILVINDGTNAVLTAVIINSTLAADTLIGASVDGHLVEFVDTASGAPVILDAIAIAPKSTVSLSFTAPLGALLNKTDSALPIPGSHTKVEFTFAENGFVKTDALVFTNEDLYESITPSAFAAADAMAPVN